MDYEIPEYFDDTIEFDDEQEYGQEEYPDLMELDDTFENNIYDPNLNDDLIDLNELQEFDNKMFDDPIDSAEFYKEFNGGGVERYSFTKEANDFYNSYKTEIYSAIALSSLAAIGIGAGTGASLDIQRRKNKT